MGQETKIQWTDHTFNPWIGCSKAHTGCTNCYAEHALPVAMRPGGPLKWGEVWQGGERQMRADSGWKEPLKWARDAAREGERRRVFCASLADVLEVPSLPESWPATWTEAQRDLARARVFTTGRMIEGARERLWDTIRATASICPACGPVEDAGHDIGCARTGQDMPGLDWLLLTKRPENGRLVPEDLRPLAWLGTSISDQKTADEWVPRLFDAQGFRLRFLSVEPLVGPVDLSPWLKTVARCSGCGFRTADRDALNGCKGYCYDPTGKSCNAVPCQKCQRVHHLSCSFAGISWVVVGGESGPKARPCSVEWVQDVVRQCREAGVPCFVKQLGSAPWRSLPLPPPSYGAECMRLSDKKGGNMAEWPEGIRVRQFPSTAA